MTTPSAPKASPGRRQTTSVVCATPTGHNPGMSSVDLAIARLAAEHDFGDVTLWRLWDHDARGIRPLAETGAEWQDPHTALRYHLLLGHLDAALDADVVLFWGDFLHLGSYLQVAAANLRSVPGFADLVPDVEALYRHLLLADADADTLDRTLTFGSTLLLDGPHEHGGRYTTALDRFVGGIHRAWFRDPHSAVVARALRDDDLTTIGVDAATLSTPLSDTTGPGDLGTLGVFFGRSDAPPEALARFARGLARRLGLRPTEVPWGAPPTFYSTSRRRRFRLAFPELAHVGSSTSARTGVLAALHPLPDVDAATSGEVLDSLAGHDVIVTDTYHLAVNAWSRGIPTICVTDPPRGTSWNVNLGDPRTPRDKRQVFCATIEADRFVVRSDELVRRRSAARAVQHAADALRDDAAVLRATGRLRQLRSHAEHDLVHTIHRLLEPDRAGSAVVVDEAG
jgi:hypothetical protein